MTTQHATFDTTRALAKADLAAASTDEAVREIAEKAVEVGEVYVIYERLLEEADAVDFGDLIRHAVTLTRSSPTRTVDIEAS